MHGTDGLGGAEVPRVPLHGGHLSEKVIWECLKAHPREITIIALGPLTNVSRVLARDPSIVELIGELVVCGGTVHGAGSATPVADFNFYCDPAAARHVLREPLTKTLVPLETTSQVVLGFNLLDELPDDFSRAGMILRRMLGHAFRAHRQILGSEGICLHDVVAAERRSARRLRHGGRPGLHPARVRSRGGRDLTQRSPATRTRCGWRPESAAAAAAGCGRSLPRPSGPRASCSRDS
jgi:inosine-uridine nucleoside N-ribohydrolase